MRETDKAMRRRHNESGFPWIEVFKGVGIDVGSGTNPMQGGDWWNCQAVQLFDIPDGQGDDLTKFFPDRQFDFVHASQVLEHAINPKVMLQSWLDCLKPGGYIVATVPDWELYEKKIWPSKWNAGHRTRWTMNAREAMHQRVNSIVSSKDLILLPQWLEQFPIEILLCRLVDTSDHSLDPMIDQTWKPEDNVEVFIEFVLRKK